MSRLGQVFAWRSFLVVVTRDPAPPRRRGSTLTLEQCALDPLPEDDQVFTLLILHNSGRHTWPVERCEDTVARWEAAGRRML